MIGRSIGGFEIVRKLGSGGMGEVYLAAHRRIDRRVAIKILRAELTSEPELVARFLTEARATSLIKHPGIVEVFDCDVADDGHVYLVMELLEGESLGAALDRVRALADDADAAMAVAGLAADALAAAHARGIVHRDLKPENIFLARPAGAGPLAVKVLDFGVAKLAGDVAGLGPATQPGTILGTPAYMSPEQCKGSRGIDQRSDVYALGCILFDMLVGRPPFVAGSPGELLVAHVHEPAPVPSSLRPEISPELDELVARMLAKQPDARLASMADVVAHLESLLGVGVADFASRIPAGSRLLGGGDGVPVAVVAELPLGAAGDTQVLRARSDTTFRHAASESLAPAGPPQKVAPRRSRWGWRGWMVGASTAAAVVVAGLMLEAGGAWSPRARRAPAAPPAEAAPRPAWTAPQVPAPPVPVQIPTEEPAAVPAPTETAPPAPAEAPAPPEPEPPQAAEAAPPAPVARPAKARPAERSRASAAAAAAKRKRARFYLMGD